MALRDDPPTLELSDFRSPRVCWLFLLLWLRMTAWGGALFLLFVYLPARVGCHIGQHW